MTTSPTRTLPFTQQYYCGEGSESPGNVSQFQLSSWLQMVQAYSESYSEEDRAWLNQLSQNLSIYTPTPEEEQNLRQRIYMIASTHKWNKDVSQDSDPALGLNQLSENFSVYTPTPEVEQNLRDRITLLAATNKWDKDVSRDSGAALPGLTQSKTAARNPARKLCYSSDDGV